MNLKEKLIPSETPSRDSREEQPKLQKPFSPIEQRLEGCIELVNNEYISIFGKEPPQEIGILLAEALKGKPEEERDLILDDTIALIQANDNPIYDIREYLMSCTGKKIENSNEQAKTERNEIRYDLKNNAKLLKESVTKLDGTGKNYNSVLLKIQALQFDEKGNEEQDKMLKAEINTILSELQNPETLFALSLDLKQENTQAYETFKASVIAIEPSFEAKFVALEPKLMLALGNDTLTNATITGDSITQTSPDKYTTTAKLDGEDRTLGRSDSQYRVKSTLESDELIHEEADRVENELNERIEPMTRKLQSLDTTKRYLETTTTADLSEVKESIKNAFPEIYAELGLEGLNMLADIVRVIEAQSDKLTKEKEEIKDKAKEYLESLTKRHKKELAEKQEVQKKILNFLHEIGFDKIPQATLNMIIENINFAPKKYGLMRKIDFENGFLGFDTDFGDRDISEGEKQKFIELFNRMITGSSEYPIKLQSGIISFHASQEDAMASIPAGFTFDLGDFINRNLGASQVYKAMRNLEKKGSEKV